MGKGVPERLILFEGGEKSPEAETSIETDGLVLILVLEVGDSVCAGKKNDVLNDAELDPVFDILLVND